MKLKTALALLLLTSLSGCLAKNGMNPSRVQAGPAYRLAVLPFESSNPYIPGAILSDHFTVEILQTVQKVDVIERKDLIKILQEQKLTLTGLIRSDKFLKLGSILGVDSIVVGSVQTLETIQGDRGAISVMVKVVDVSTGKILWADRKKIYCGTWGDHEVTDIAEKIMEKTAEKMVKRMGKNLAARPFSALAAQTGLETVHAVQLTTSKTRSKED